MFRCHCHNIGNGWWNWGELLMSWLWFSKYTIDDELNYLIIPLYYPWTMLITWYIALLLWLLSLYIFILMITHDTDGPFDNSIINHEPLLSFAFFNSTIDTWKAEIWSNWFIIIHAEKTWFWLILLNFSTSFFVHPSNHSLIT